MLSSAKKRGQSKVSGGSLLRQFGVYRAESIEEFFDIARSSIVGTLPANDRMAMVTFSNGVGVLMVDGANRARGG